jgi:lipid-A-disaccharide synthase
VRQSVNTALAFGPDVIVIIDSPEFTHPIARHIRRRRPDIPIVDYVSPSVWAWRPGRARSMRDYIDCVLALLPFEPEAHAKLGGPSCLYVGHPLIERQAELASLDTKPLADRLGLDGSRPVLVMLPGSRSSEIAHLLEPFGRAVALMRTSGMDVDVVLPTVPHLRAIIERGVARWGFPVHIIEGEDDKFRAFKLARAALAASGTVTLELALIGTPMVVAYKVDRVMVPLRFLLQVPSVVLANLVLGENVFPELLQEKCTPELLAAELRPLLSESPARERQLAALARIPERLSLVSGAPSDAAADIVLRYARQGRWPAV